MKKALSIAALLMTALTGTALADGSYNLAVKAPSAKANAKGVAKVTVKPKGDYHVNLEYPTKLTIVAPDGVTVEKAKQTSKDAAKFDETEAEFQVAFKADAPGKKTFSGEFKFAMCQGTKACEPKVEKISFDVDVK